MPVEFGKLALQFVNPIHGESVNEQLYSERLLSASIFSIDRKTKQAKGAASKGKSIYVEYCKSCHGADGKNYNFKAKAGKKEYLSTVANNNPWEALHKLINGHPGASSDSKMGMGGMGGMGGGHMRMFMPGMHGRINSSGYADLLAYLQSLPK